MVYMCETCNKTFTNLAKYNRHLNIANTCDPEIREQIRINKLTCKKCGKIFSGQTALRNHTTICSVKQMNISDLNSLKDIIINLSDTVAKQSEKIDKQTEKMSEQSSQINQQNDKLKQLLEKNSVPNITVNQTQNIYGLNAFGNETLDHLTIADYNNIFEKGCRAVQYLVERVHCNKDVPKNRNIYIGNFKDEHCRIYNGNSWIVESKDDVIHNLFHTKRDLLEAKYKMLKGSLTSDAKYFFGKMYFEHGTTKEGEALAKEDIKNLLYENRLYVAKKLPKKIKKFIICNVDQSENDYIPEEFMF